MDFALTYLLGRFFFRIADFLRHWYGEAVSGFNLRAVNFFERLDRVFAVKVTIRYFARPLYGDYTPVGRILGIIFRAGRVLIGISVYVLIGAAIFAFYVVWFLVPPLLLYLIVRDFNAA